MIESLAALQISSAEFTLEIPACSFVRAAGETQKIIINFGAGSSITFDLREVECSCNCPSFLRNPPAPYNLNDCPRPTSRRKVFAWDCETSFEAKNEAEAAAHDNEVRPVPTFPPRIYPQKPAWVKDCQKCIECSGFDLGTEAISIGTTAKACQPCGPETDTRICNGYLRSEAPRVISNPFYGECLIDYDIYAKVDAVFDNWGYIKDAYGTAITTTCSNENNDICEICTKQEVIGPLKGVQADPESNPPEEGMQQVGVDSWVINSLHGGPNSIGATVEFYFEPKPKP